MSTEHKVSKALLYRILEPKPRKGEERKIRILEAVIESIATKGIDGTTFEAIGKKVKMERAHVNYYFANREDLIKAAVKYVVAIGQEIVIEHVAPTTQWMDLLRAVVEGSFIWLERFPHHAAVMGLFYYMASYDKECKDLQDQIRTGGEKRILASLQSLIDEKRLSKKDAVDITRTVQAQMAGNLTYFFTGNHPLPLKQLRENSVQLALELVQQKLRN